MPAVLQGPLRTAMNTTKPEEVNVYRVGKNRFLVVSTQNAEIMLTLLRMLVLHIFPYEQL